MISRGARANLFLGCAIVAEVIATVSLKAVMHAPWLVIVVGAGYAAAFWLLALTLRNGKGIGVAYGIWGASGVVLTALASWALFDERITPLMGAGFALIAAGVIVVEVGSEVHQRRLSRPGRGIPT
ncbi:SMR family transporter [Leucobacter sp. gxy201]|uniref:DMT family transporter n=1 Tax=Leucobacter sp. gxy201 TaxID=2957200 RepID=UPI003DA18FA3